MDKARGVAVDYKCYAYAVASDWPLSASDPKPFIDAKYGKMKWLVLEVPLELAWGLQHRTPHEVTIAPVIDFESDGKVVNEN
jgi:hypothetical protein